ncbi:MAG: HAMP domain-containing sensor histidine kinase [Eubacteriales bacterium]|nr:HAMP domain-containing sensor histidine kinase [Eubacteriales bacterium]
MECEGKRRLVFWKEDWSISLKLSIVILLLLFGLIPMALCSQTILNSVRQSQIEARMVEVQNQAQILSSKMTRTGYFHGEGQDFMDSEIVTMADVYSGRVVVVNQDFRITLDTFHVAENRLNISEEVLRCFQGENSSRLNREKHYFAQTVPVYDGSPGQGIEGVLVVTASTEALTGLTDAVGDKVALFQVILFLVMVILAAAAAVFLLRPFREFQSRLNHVAQGALDTDISGGVYREIRDISDAVGKTIDKLRAVDQSRQEFVSNVSHELKTPITSIRVLADSLMGMGEVPVELYREFMEDISDEIDRESKIIDDLLSLVKMDKSEAELNIAQVNVNTLVEQTLKRLRPIANKRKVELIFESIRDVTADVDEMKLSLAVTNLVENAIKYNVEEGWVRVTLDADHKFFYLKVADSGIGIPEEVQDRIFERFFRVDKARSRETGGSGLGLAITRNVVLMHKGAIKLSSKDGEGSVFTLRIPLNYIA